MPTSSQPTEVEDLGLPVTEGTKDLRLKLSRALGRSRRDSGDHTIGELSGQVVPAFLPPSLPSVLGIADWGLLPQNRSWCCISAGASWAGYTREVSGFFGPGDAPLVGCLDEMQ